MRPETTKENFKKEFEGTFDYPASPFCKECGGACCKNYAGCLIPSDLKPPFVASLKALLDTGNWVIDTWYDVKTVRPRHAQETGILADGKHGCVFLTDAGCTAPIKPFECRMLQPKSDKSGHCEAHAGRSRIEAAWEPYQHVLNDLLREDYDS
jgi:hypothetical protein